MTLKTWKDHEQLK